MGAISMLRSSCNHNGRSCESSLWSCTEQYGSWKIRWKQRRPPAEAAVRTAAGFLSITVRRVRAGASGVRRPPSQCLMASRLKPRTTEKRALSDSGQDAPFTWRRQDFGVREGATSAREQRRQRILEAWNFADASRKFYCAVTSKSTVFEFIPAVRTNK